MDTLLDWARGPVFLFAITFTVLGLLRHVALTVWEVTSAVRRAGDQTMPYRTVLRATLEWLFPLRKVRYRLLFSLTSVLFHVAVIIVPIFLAGHIALWTRGLGISWPAIPNGLADVLTLTGIITAVALVVERLAARATRGLSRFEDYFLPLAIAVPFATGYLVAHPAVNPFGFEATLFVHVMSGNLVLILTPLTKLSHMVLLPGTQLVSEVAWHWPSDAGSKLAVTLGKEGEPV
jgi:nitrate reductase gamma subunit